MSYCLLGWCEYVLQSTTPTDILDIKFMYYFIGKKITHFKIQSRYKNVDFYNPNIILDVLITSL